MQIRSAPNFRPLPLARPGTLYRSDHLGAITPADARVIQELGIRRVLDFRGVHERAGAMCAIPGMNVHALSIEPTVVQQLAVQVESGRMPTESDVVAVMQDTYRGFVNTSSHRFAEFFQHLLASGEPTVFHCTAGKDRTGFAAALLLRLLGADDETVMRDYLRTNDLHEPHWLATTKLPLHVANVLVRVQPAFLHASYEAIEARHGSFEAFVRDGLGLEGAQREKLRDLYLARPEPLPPAAPIP